MEFKNRTIRMTELINTIQQANVMDMPWLLPDNSIDCCVTSPPYWGLRDYGVTGQLGQEKTPEEYVTNMVSVFEEVRRVLKPEGTLWLNLGDSYAGGGRAGNNPDSMGKHKMFGKAGWNQSVLSKPQKIPYGLKAKDLVGIPWMIAFALRSAGWYLRQDIIWHKPNPMPESVKDRCTKAHEYIFMFSKSPKYYYDYEAIRTPAADSSIHRWNQDLDNQQGSNRVPGKTNGTMKDVGGKQRGHSRRHNGFNDRWDAMSVKEQQSMGANKRSVWDVEEDRYKVWEWLFKNADESLIEPLWEKFLLEQQKESVWKVSTAMYSDAHFATFPEALITPCILAGCPKASIVLDPFMGAGTTALVAMSHGRNYIGYELNPEYIDIANKRLKKHFGMFA